MKLGIPPMESAWKCPGESDRPQGKEEPLSSRWSVKRNFSECFKARAHTYAHTGMIELNQNRGDREQHKHVSRGQLTSTNTCFSQPLS